jgi:outer membrane protein assembly factor BamA
VPHGYPLSYLEDRETRAYISGMSARGLLPVTPLLAVCISSAFGQLPKRVEKCLPYPTLAQEIRDMQPVPPKIDVHVISVEFDANSGIASDAQEQISTELQSRTFQVDANTDYMNDVANEIAEVDVRVPLQDRGYFRATTAARLAVLKDEGPEVSVAVTISAEPGPQYRLGDIRTESANSSFPLKLSSEALQGLIPLQGGELFSVEGLRAGLKKITRAYAGEGYIDMTAAPVLKIDEGRGIIDVVLKIDQQVQYRVGSIEFLGTNTVTQEKLMESLPKPGEVFDWTRLEDFFKVNRAILPSDVSRDDVNVKRDPGSNTVAILFDFRTCPPHSN